MRRVKVNIETMRRWRANRRAVVDEKGSFIRYLESQEVADLEERQRKGMSVTLKVEGKAVSLTTDRDLLLKEFQNKYSEDLLLLAPNGRMLKRIRIIPKATSKTNMVKAPHPSRCVCASWKGKEEGKHHPLCEWNKHAPMEQRGDLETKQDLVLKTPESKPEPEPEQPEVAVKPEEPIPLEISSSGTISNSKKKIQIQIPKPEDCVCQAWKVPKGERNDIHHPMCEWRIPWLEAHPIPDVKVQHVKDILSGEILREASAEEIEDSQLRAADSGISTTFIDGIEYLVEP